MRRCWGICAGESFTSRLRQVRGTGLPVFFCLAWNVPTTVPVAIGDIGDGQADKVRAAKHRADCCLEEREVARVSRPVSFERMTPTSALVKGCI